MKCDLLSKNRESFPEYRAGAGSGQLDKHPVFPPGYSDDPVFEGFRDSFCTGIHVQFRVDVLQVKSNGVDADE